MATILEVSALNTYVRSLLDDDPNLGDVALRGEVSNFNRHHKTGHCYFTLKDARASIKSVLFRGEADRLSFRPQNGDMVIARGRVSLYEAGGAYQFYADTMVPEGLGAQQSAFDELKEKLNREGLFAPEHKKPVPAFPRIMGVITSKSGAVLQDIRNVAQRRNPCVKLVLAPVSVQGTRAAAEIRGALELLDGSVDVILIARGGGSAEDLSAFNDEKLARAVYVAETPVISAVGHEIDFTILDFVADLRAPTPSAATELALPDLRGLLASKATLCMNMGQNIHKKLELCYNTFNSLEKHPALAQLQGRPAEMRKTLAGAARALRLAGHRRLAVSKEKLQNTMQLAGSLNPYGVLQRGYAVVTKEGRPVGGVADVAVGDAIEVALSDGQLCADVTKRKPKEE